MAEGTAAARIAGDRCAAPRSRSRPLLDSAQSGSCSQAKRGSRCSPSRIVRVHTPIARCTSGDSFLAVLALADLQERRLGRGHHGIALGIDQILPVPFPGDLALHRRAQLADVVRRFEQVAGAAQIVRYAH